VRSRLHASGLVLPQCCNLAPGNSSVITAQLLVTPIYKCSPCFPNELEGAKLYRRTQARSRTAGSRTAEAAAPASSWGTRPRACSRFCPQT
jgi:hypothetical protein